MLIFTISILIDRNMTLKQFFSAAVMFICLPLVAFGMQKTWSLSSPDGRIVAEVLVGDGLRYSISRDGTALLAPSRLSMTFDDGTMFGGATDKIRRVKRGSHDVKGIPAMNYKKATVDDVYNFLTLEFKGYNVEFRAFDNGVAYRFVSTAKSGEFTVTDELTEFNFAQDWTAWVPYVKDAEGKTFKQQFVNPFENTYEHIHLSQMDPAKLAFLPMTVDAAGGVKIVITESDLLGYPGMFLNGHGGKSLKSVRAPYPIGLRPNGVYVYQDMDYADYIAKVEAGQKFPWKVIGIAPDAKSLMDMDLVWQLATPADENMDWSWVKPGKVAWEWWNDWNVYGVDFLAGINTETYKYYIDFAAAHGIEYIIMDKGWAQEAKANLFLVNPDINLEELVSYADGKNVGIILWASYNSIVKNPGKAMSHYARMGFKGFKIDYINRDDQQAVMFCERMAKIAAENHLLIDFHGIYKPAGIQRTYPNMLNFEGVAGLEQLKWSPESYDEVTYDVTAPFVRMVAGPMDYTQGAMRNATRKNYQPVKSEAMSQGTRCRQLAEYAVFEAPLTMLCDSPSNYMAEPECTEFIAEFPTVWDETVPLCGEIGEYLAVARRSGDVWYVGALTNWDARELTLDLSFIKDGKMTIFQDGINADRAARDYKKTSAQVPADGIVKVKMASGGGWAAMITR